MKTRTAAALAALPLLAATSSAHAVGYYLLVERLQTLTGLSADGIVGYKGFSTTEAFSALPSEMSELLGNVPFAAMADFDGNGIPEVVTDDAVGGDVCIFPDFSNASEIVHFLGNNNVNTGGPITITPPTITIAGKHLPNIPMNFTFDYTPGGTPTPESPTFDLDGDGIPDTVTFNTTTGDIDLVNGATQQVTSFEPASSEPLVSLTIVTWSPAIAAAPEPTSLSLLALALPLLLKRRR